MTKNLLTFAPDDAIKRQPADDDDDDNVDNDDDDGQTTRTEKDTTG